MGIRILKREQYYLDLFLPSLNVNKIAGSMLGLKHSDADLLRSGRIQRGKNKSSPKVKRNYSPIMGLRTPETIDKLKQRANGVIIKTSRREVII